MAASPADKQLLSLVIPCYNEEEVLEETLRRLQGFCDALDDLDAEMIFVDDGSRDGTRARLARFVDAEPRARLICFARNFGQQAAVTAGIDAARGDAVVLLDADLQDPPEVVHEMLAKWREGYDVVYGVRRERLGEGALKLATARWFYRVQTWFAETPIPQNTGDFRLMSRAVADAFRAMPERDRFVRGMLSWTGFRQAALPYRRAERFAGSTKYSLRSMLPLAVTGILSFSTRPLRLSLWAGLLLAALGLVLLAGAAALRLCAAPPHDLGPAILAAVVFLGGVQLISVGVLGEYIGRIHREMQQRPLYLVDEYRGFGAEPPAGSRSPVGRALPGNGGGQPR